MPKKYSKTVTLKDCISHLLMPDIRLTSEEIDDLIGYAIEVFISCDRQIPIDLAKRLYQVQVDLAEFTDICSDVMSVMGINEEIIIN